MDHLHLVQLHQEGRVGNLRILEPCGLYRIVNIHRICIAGMAWFVIHIQEDPSDNLSNVYVYFTAYDMFTMDSEFAINQLIIAHLLYDGERVAIKGHMM